MRMEAERSSCPAGTTCSPALPPLGLSPSGHPTLRWPPQSWEEQAAGDGGVNSPSPGFMSIGSTAGTMRARGTSVASSPPSAA